jgi:hypothetical protein
LLCPIGTPVALKGLGSQPTPLLGETMRRPLAGTALAAAAVLATTVLAACGDSVGVSTSGQVNMSAATRPASSSAAASSASGASAAAVVPPLTLTDGANTLTITDVQLVLREIELRRVDESACGGSGGGADSCEKLELGPILLDLPLGVGATHVFSADVAAGSYNEIDFEIHKPSDDDASDAAFRQAHPELDGVSIKVTGSYNGQDFTYTSDLDAEQEIELSPPLVVGSTGSADLTLMVDLDHWFRDGAGVLVDPATAVSGQVNANLVADNIRATLRAFEDENHDGSDDHGGDGAAHE